MKPSVLFVADMVQPQFGMERALMDLLETLREEVDFRLIVLSGEHPAWPTTNVATLGLPRGRARALRAILPLRRLLGDDAREEATIVAVGIWAAIPTLLASIGRPFRVTVWEHSLLPWRLRNAWLIRYAAHLSYRLLRRQIEEVVAVSPPVAAEVKRLTRNQKRVITIPNVLRDEPVDVDASTLRNSSSPWPDGSIKLLGVGALSNGKNWALAIRSMEHLPPDYTLAIAGDGSQRPRLQREILERGLENKVALLGFRDDVAQLLRECSILVHPSYAETFGYSLAEAAMAGRPVVCLDMPVMNTVVPDPYMGALVEDRAADFAAAITRLVEAIGVCGYAPRQTDNREAVVQDWLGVFHS
jgi:glycosyltransferase involved in cell wall biosynthesis